MDTGTLPDLSSPHPVGDESVEAYRHDGHVLVRGIATAHEVAPYRTRITEATLRRSADVAPLAERSTYGKAFLQVMNLWRDDPDVARFVMARRFAGVAAQLMGVDAVRIYHDQALFKEPGGGRTPWHQDATYWPLDGSRCITMWMPLVDITPEMGVMAFASGSAAAGALNGIEISDDSDADFERQLADGRYPISVPVPMSAGDATFHSGWTVHHARPNSSSVLREVMTIIWFADGLLVTPPTGPAQQRDLANWLPGLAPGDVAASELNPLIVA